MMGKTSKRERVLLGLGAAGLTLLPLFVPEFYTGLVNSALIAAMLALSLQLLVGCSGLVSLGHAAFYGLGAYTVYAITPPGHGLSLLLTLPAAAAVAGLAALAVGAFSPRTRGCSSRLVALAFGH